MAERSSMNRLHFLAPESDHAICLHKFGRRRVFALTTDPEKVTCANCLVTMARLITRGAKWKGKR